MSLRLFHLVLILLVMVCADLFGAWAIWHYPIRQDPVSLGLGILALVGGLGLAVYVFFLVRKLDRAHIA